MALIDALLSEARHHRSGALMLHGEAGIGKSALLDHARAHAEGMTVVEGAGFPSESGFGFAVLGQLARPLLGLVDRLPMLQARALRSALGLEEEPVHDRLLVFAALLSLLAEAAELRPTLCLIDDLQWADSASVDALAFTARRLGAEGVAVLVARRTEGTTDPTIRGVPDYALERLPRAAALRLIRDRLDTASTMTESGLLEACDGNPLALVELPRVHDEQVVMASGISVRPLPLRAKITDAFLQQSHKLTQGAQTTLLIAAADADATPEEVGRVSGDLGVASHDLADAEASGLVSSSSDRIKFRHPLVRAAVYGEANEELRRTVHGLFAALLTREQQIERHAWHRSLSTSAPDETVAVDLEHAATWSTRRGALEEASRAWQRAAEFSEGPHEAARRTMAAAETARLAGEPEPARALLGTVGNLGAGEAMHTEIEVLQGDLELRTGTPADAHAILSSAARRLSVTDPVRALRVLTQAGEAASYAGDRELIVATGVQAAELVEPMTGPERLPGLVLIGSGKVVSGEAELGRSICQEAVSLADGATEASDLVWASIAAQYGGDEVQAHSLAVRAAATARTAGQLAMLPYALEFKALAELYASRFAAAAEGLSLARELRQENSIGRHLATMACVDAAQGREAECRAWSDEALSISESRGLGLQRAMAMWAVGLLELGLGRPQDAFDWFARLLRPGAGRAIPASPCSQCPMRSRSPNGWSVSMTSGR